MLVRIASENLKKQQIKQDQGNREIDSKKSMTLKKHLKP